MTDTLARVAAVHKERYELLFGGKQLYGKLKTSVYINDASQPYPTVGDYVMIQLNLQGDSVIISTCPRKSYFSRSDPDPNCPHEQAVAANFDTVFIVQSLNQDFNLRRLERYLALAWQSGGVPVVVLTKADLTADFSPQVDAVQDIAPGVDVFALSAVTGFGLGTVGRYLQPDSTVVFLGSSGVGKSSLLNALAGKDVMRVNAIREDDAKGRHTTTHRQLITLPNGASVIDTPGMRTLGMYDAEEGVGYTFSDVEALLGSCRFADCKHGNEPGCAVRAATERGELSRERWESYQKLKRESRYAEEKAAALREKWERNKGIARWNKQSKKEIW